MVAGTFTHLLYYPFLYTIAALTTSMRRVTEDPDSAVTPVPNEPAAAWATIWQARYVRREQGVGRGV
jgi:hypothetical protein